MVSLASARENSVVGSRLGTIHVSVRPSEEEIIIRT